MLPRLIIQGINLAGTVQLPPEDARHIFSSLRMRSGDRLILCDGSGSEALCVLTAERGASVLEVSPAYGEPNVSVHLYPSLAKGERFAWMLQKAAELGAASITPVFSQRCVAKPPSSDKPERWRRILRGAAEQSGRGIIPELRETLPFRDAAALADGLRLFCYEEERTVTLKAALRSESPAISVLTGPEGGYTPEEVAFAGQNGWTPVSLGDSILRCETAPLMVLSAIRFQCMV
jgi:16S rRNA (uracil1498-N3)-methyltransferase